MLGRTYIGRDARMLSELSFYLRYRSVLRDLYFRFDWTWHTATDADRLVFMLSLGIAAVTFIVALRVLLKWRRKIP